MQVYSRDVRLVASSLSRPWEVSFTRLSHGRLFGMSFCSSREQIYSRDVRLAASFPCHLESNFTRCYSLFRRVRCPRPREASLLAGSFAQPRHFLDTSKTSSTRCYPLSCRVLRPRLRETSLLAGLFVWPRHCLDASKAILLAHLLFKSRDVATWDAFTRYHSPPSLSSIVKLQSAGLFRFGSGLTDSQFPL